MSVTQQLEATVPGRTLGGDASKRKKKSILQFEITKKKVPRKELMHFSRQLAVFIRAGIPILDALDAIAEEMGNKLLLEIVNDISRQLREGTTFATAASAHGDAFPSYYLGILRSAELTGKLDTVLEQLGDYIERDMETRRKVVSALAYPAVILATSFVVIVILVAYVLPKFESFFTSLGADLPLPTRILLGATGAISNNLIWIGLALLTATIALLATLRTARGRSAKDRILLRLPVVGDLVRHIVLERFCRILSAMMTAGVPLPEALAVTSEATNNAVYRRGIDTAGEAMMRGEGLAGPLVDTGLFPPSAKQMFRVGESTGTLDAQLNTAAAYFDRKLDYKIKRFTALFEPAVLLFVGLVVGFVAIALVSAMYGIFDAARPS